MCDAGRVVRIVVEMRRLQEWWRAVVTILMELRRWEQWWWTWVPWYELEMRSAMWGSKKDGYIDYQRWGLLQLQTFIMHPIGCVAGTRCASLVARHVEKSVLRFGCLSRKCRGILGDWEWVEKSERSSILTLWLVHNDGGKYLSNELLREVSFQKRLDPRQKWEMTDFLNEVLASHCLANGDPCKVGEL